MNQKRFVIWTDLTDSRSLGGLFVGGNADQAAKAGAKGDKTKLTCRTIDRNDTDFIEQKKNMKRKIRMSSLNEGDGG